jgi:hypothetical protein
MRQETIFFVARPRSWARASYFRGFEITLRHTTLGGTPLDEWSARQRLLPDNTQHSQETDIHAPERFELAIPASEQPQTHALDHMATGIGQETVYREKMALQFYVI